MSKTTSAYTPTLMEKLLGKHYKWWFVVRYEQKLAFIDRWNLLIIILRFLIPLAVTFILISTISETSEAHEYLLPASLIYQFYVLFIGPASDLTNMIISGHVTKHFLRPTSFWALAFWRFTGYNFFPLIVRLTIFCLTIAIFQIKINFSFNILIAFLLILLTCFISFHIEKTLASISFFNLQGNKTFLPFVYDAMPFLSGSLINFSLLGTGFGFLKYTPFSYISFHPMQIYLGNYNLNQTLLVFAGGLAWCFVLYFLAKWVFKMGLKRNESVGL